MSTDPDISRTEWLKSSYSGTGGQNCLEWVPTAWIKSSYSGAGGGNCLEWAPTVWAKSSYSGDGGDHCLEWTCFGRPGIIPVRDSKTPDGPVLTFSPGAWAAFVTAVRSGDA